MSPSKSELIKALEPDALTEQNITEKLRDALEMARHELTTLHGLIAADGAAPRETWSIDTMGVTSVIDDVLNEVFCMNTRLS